MDLLEAIDRANEIEKQGNKELSQCIKDCINAIENAIKGLQQ